MIATTVKINNYDNFSCIAGACPFTCCQEWEIPVDEDTFRQWKGKSLGDVKNIRRFVDVKKDGKAITLQRDRMCPFLNEEKLCNLVLTYGESCLSATCHSFPRQIETQEGWKEYSLSTCCPVVLDEIYKEGKAVRVKEGAEITDLWYGIREFAFHVLEERKESLPQKWLMVYFVLLDFMEKSMAKPIEEYEKELSQIAQAIDQMNFKQENTFWENNELFLDVIHNYRKQGLYTQYVTPLGEMGEQFERGEEAFVKEEWEAFLKAFASYEKFCIGLCVSELFANMLTGDEDTFLMMYVWSGLEYSILRHVLFFYWREHGELSYENIKGYLVVVTRMMGYAAEDVAEYMEEHFEENIWDWGYFALVLGNDNM